MTTTAQPVNADALIRIEEQWGAHNYHPLDIVIERAEGAWVHDVEGKKYLDCLSAYSAVNQGHCHPRILETMLEQARKVTLTSRAFRNDQLPLFCKELAEFCEMEAAPKQSIPRSRPRVAGAIAARRSRRTRPRS
jgi:ornithine--oxo-acid transaminase